LDPSQSAPGPRFTTLDDWLAWLETLHPKKIDFSLDRVRAVLAALAIDAPKYRIVTVAGTNGKGSCVAILESIYLAAGYRVGAFTSPHLWRFNERIRFGGRDASDAELVELFELMDAARGDVTLSYFEASAVAAALYFARKSADVAVLEVGMGGRLDATNALDADAALIVSVDLDHMDWLGPDREAIGREKAGIIRTGRPVVVADADPPGSVVGAIEACGAMPQYIGRDFSVEPDPEGLAFVRPGGSVRRFPRPPFGDEHQLVNAAAAIAVVESLAEMLPVDDRAIAEGLATVRLRGRIERCEIAGVEWVFDVAHNVAATRHLHDTLARLPPSRRTIVVFGAMRDKQLEGVVAPFVGQADAWFVAPVESERGASPELLRAVLEGLGASDVESFASVADATRAAAATDATRVLVFGSFYTVGPAMAALGLYSTPSAG